MQIIHFTGNLGRDPELRSIRNGDQVCNFSVAVRQGFDRDAKSEWFRCSVFGKRGEVVSRFLRKGMKVTVAGNLTIGEYEGRPQYEVRVIDVEWPHDSGSEQRHEDRPDDRQQSRSGYPDDLDDDVPF